jgi:tetratricopeptide (TPR) repeat protein
MRSALCALLVAASIAGCGLPAGIRRGDSLVASYHYDDAEAAYVEAAAKAPFEGWRGACRARMYGAKLEAALEACEKAVAAPHSDASALVLKGRVLRALGRHPDAVTALKAAHAADPEDRSAIAWLSMALADDLRRGEALSSMRAWVDERPDNSVRWAELAVLQSYVYDLDDAEGSWRKVIDLDPTGNGPAAYASLAELFLLRDRPLDARRAAETALDRAPENVYAGAVLARALAANGEAALARERMDRSAPAGSKVLWALLARAEVSRLVGTPGDAIGALEEASRLDVTDERVLYEAGRLFEAKKDMARAIASYEEALKIRPFYLEARWRVALASEKGDAAVYQERLRAFVAMARDVAALRAWVDDALKRLPPEGPAAPAPASAPAEPSPG